MDNITNSVDLIIINYNSTGYLLSCLRSIYDSLHGFPVRVLVQDNGSEDGVDRVEADFPQVRLFKNRYNLGFAKAINNALEQGSAPYVVLINPDSVVIDGFFPLIIGYMEKNPDVGIAGPKILDKDGSVQGSARTFPTPLTGLFGRSSMLTRLFPNNPFSRENILTAQSNGETPMEVDWVSGACLVVRRKAIEIVGPLDEQFFMYWEDADWCRRMWENGWKVVYFPKASIIHYVGVSSDKAILRSGLEFHKSSYRLFNKYNKGSRWFLNPFAITGLSLRLCFLLILNTMRNINRRI